MGRLIILFIMFFVVSCATEEQKLEAYKAKCKEFGWSVKSNEYKSCIEKLYDSAHW